MMVSLIDGSKQHGFVQATKGQGFATEHYVLWPDGSLTWELAVLLEEV